MGESDGEDAQIDANMRSNMLKLLCPPNCAGCWQRCRSSRDWLLKAHEPLREKVCECQRDGLFEVAQRKIDTSLAGPCVKLKTCLVHECEEFGRCNMRGPKT